MTLERPPKVREGSVEPHPSSLSGRNFRTSLDSREILTNLDFRWRARLEVGTTLIPQKMMWKPQRGSLGLLSNSRRRKRSQENSAAQRQLPLKPKMTNTKSSFRQMETCLPPRLKMRKAIRVPGRRRATAEISQPDEAHKFPLWTIVFISLPCH